jgi:hypothetical protein
VVVLHKYKVIYTYYVRDASGHDYIKFEAASNMEAKNKAIEVVAQAETEHKNGSASHTYQMHTLFRIIQEEITEPVV